VKNKILYSLIVLFLLPFTVMAAPRIVNVDFVGLVKTSEITVRRQIKSLEGSPYSSRSVQRDIKALYKTGLFQDVYVEKKQIGGGLRLIFHVLEKGVIKGIVFRGNKKLKDKDLINAVTLREHNLLDERRLAESKEAIRELYEKKGYHLVEISADVVPLDTEKNEIELVFQIEENRQVRIKRISFVGNKIFSDRKLTKQMVTKVKGFLSFISGSGKLKDEKLERDVAALTYFYLNKNMPTRSNLRASKRRRFVSSQIVTDA